MINPSKNQIFLEYQSLNEFCKTPEKYDLCLNKEGVLSAEKKVFLISRLRRFLFKNYNFPHIINELSQKLIQRTEEISTERLLEKIENKAEKYAQKKPCFLFKRDKSKINQLFQAVKNRQVPEQLKQLKSLLQTDQELKDVLNRYGIQTEGDIFEIDHSICNCKQQLENMEIVPCTDKLQIDQIKDFFTNLYQQDLISFFSSVVERNPEQTDEEYVQTIKDFLSSSAAQSIKSLSINQQKLGCIPQEVCAFKNLEELDLSETRILSFAGIKNLSSLKDLNLSNNEYIEELPPEIYDLENLERVDLRKTNITTMPKATTKTGKSFLCAFSHEQTMVILINAYKEVVE